MVIVTNALERRKILENKSSKWQRIRGALTRVFRKKSLQEPAIHLSPMQRAENYQEALEITSRKGNGTQIVNALAQSRIVFSDEESLYRDGAAVVEVPENVQMRMAKRLVRVSRNKQTAYKIADFPAYLLAMTGLVTTVFGVFLIPFSPIPAAAGLTSCLLGLRAKKLIENRMGASLAKNKDSVTSLEYTEGLSNNALIELRNIPTLPYDFTHYIQQGYDSVLPLGNQK